MHCRWVHRRWPVLLWSLLALTATAGSARAHRLEAEYRVLPGRRVQVESWFDLTGTSPRGAQVKVLRADGSTLTQGKLNSQGVFVFTYGEPEALKVVVDAVGHRKELDIPAREMTQAEAPATAAKGPAAPATTPAGSVDPKPFADRTPRVSVKDVLIGIGFLLAVAAFVLSLRNARQLRELKRAPPEGGTRPRCEGGGDPPRHLATGRTVPHGRAPSEKGKT